MRFPEGLYRIREPDRAQAFPGAWVRTTRTSQAAATVSASLQQDLSHRLIILTHVAALISPGAGQNYLAGSRLMLFPPEGTEPAIAINLKRFNAAAGAAIEGTLDWQGEIPVPPLWWINGTGVFNAGAVANVVTITAIGWSIPLGNVTLT